MIPITFMDAFVNEVSKPQRLPNEEEEIKTLESEIARKEELFTKKEAFVMQQIQQRSENVLKTLEMFIQTMKKEDLNRVAVLKIQNAELANEELNTIYSSLHRALEKTNEQVNSENEKTISLKSTIKQLRRQLRAKEGPHDAFLKELGKRAAHYTAKMANTEKFS